MRLLLAAPALWLAGCAAMQDTAPVADHHQHLLRAETIATLMRVESRIAPIEAEQLVAMLDAAGVRKATLLSMGYSLGAPSRNLPDEYQRVAAENDWTAAQAAKHPQRLAAFCGVNPLKDYAIAEIARCAGVLRVKGLKLHLGNSDVQLEDDAHVARMQAVFAAANAHRLAIVVHMRASISRKRPYGAAQARAFIDKLLPMAPDIAVQVAHMATAGPGYDDPPAREVFDVLAAAVAAGDARMRNVWFDASGIVHDRLPPGEAALLAADMRRVGFARVLFGSDAAVPPNLAPREAWAAFLRLPLRPDELARVARNVAPWLE